MASERDMVEARGENEKNRFFSLELKWQAILTHIVSL